MTQDEQSLNVLAIFHYVVGGMTALFACIPLIHLAIGIAMVSGAFEGNTGEPAFLGWFFIAVAGFIILTGWILAFVIIVAGRKLKRREARTYCLVVAGLECMLMPWGTILGVFTIVVLMKEPVKELFLVEQVP